MNIFKEFFFQQIEVTTNFFSGTNKLQRIIFLITIGVIFHTLFDYYSNLFGVTNFVSKHLIPTILGFFLNTLIIGLFPKVFIFKQNIKNVSSTNLMLISKFLYSSKTQKDIFAPIDADWQEEYFEALHKKEIWKARWINVRYTYAFIMTMWQKSPLGDLLEYVRKFAS